MKLLFFSLLICLLALDPATAQNLPLGAPPFPPEDWDLSIDFQLNDGLVCEMMGIRQPAEEAEPAEWAQFRREIEEAHCDELKNEITIEIGHSFSAQTTAAITGSDSNPLINANAAEAELTGLGFEENQLGFIPIHDQRLIYLAAIHAIAEFKFPRTKRPYTRIDPGIDIRLRLTINRETAWLHLHQVDPTQPPSVHLAEAIALLQRNLPGRYQPLFDLFKLPTLAAIPDDAKTDYGKCPVHEAQLLPGTVKKQGGTWNAAYFELEKTRFPEANVHVYTGWCGTGQDFSRDQQVLFCPTCREVRKAWLESVPDLKAYRH